MEYADQVPDDIVNGVPTEEKVAAEPKKKGSSVSKHSSFIITINPNVSVKKTPTPELRRVIGAKLLKLNHHIRSNFAAGQLVKKRMGAAEDWQPPALESWKSALELSEKNGWIHSHSTVGFAGEVHVDLVKLRALLKTEFPGGCHLDVRYYKDTKKIIESYVSKASERPPMVKGHPKWKEFIPEPEIM